MYEVPNCAKSHVIIYVQEVEDIMRLAACNSASCQISVGTEATEINTEDNKSGNKEVSSSDNKDSGENDSKNDGYEYDDEDDTNYSNLEVQNDSVRVMDYVSI